MGGEFGMRDLLACNQQTKRCAVILHQNTNTTAKRRERMNEKFKAEKTK
jgi:hypothetical protein